MGKPSDASHANHFTPAPFSTELLRAAGTPRLEFLGDQGTTSSPHRVKSLQAHKYSFEDVSLILQGHESFGKHFAQRLKAFLFRANQVPRLLHFNSFQIHPFHTKLECLCSPGVPGCGNGFTSLSQPSGLRGHPWHDRTF